VRRLLCIAAIALAASACGGSTAQPTPRPTGQRGTLLNPIDRARNSVNQQNQQTSQNEQRFGGEYEQGNPPP
jgi:hypothetical protein